VTDILLWMPVGALWRLDEPRRKLAAIAHARRCSPWASSWQLSWSRVTDISDVLTSTAGAWLGAAGVLPSLRALGGDAMRRRRMAAVGLWLWLLVTLMVYGWPFAWHWPAAGGLAFVDAFTRVPFVTYFQRNEFGALNEILRKLLVFLPGGLLLRLWSTAPGLRPSRSGLLALCVLAFLLEAGQVVLADRVADLTDALLACLGATLGWVLSGWLQMRQLAAVGHRHCLRPQHQGSEGVPAARAS
jgi:glycopeptide antibiotics resistance protein